MVVLAVLVLVHQGEAVLVVVLVVGLLAVMALLVALLLEQLGALAVRIRQLLVAALLDFLEAWAHLAVVGLVPVFLVLDQVLVVQVGLGLTGSQTQGV